MRPFGSAWHGPSPPALHLLLDVVFDLAAGRPDVVTCAACGATWEGGEGLDCRWCATAAARQREWQRHMLLWPAWADTGQSTRYDDLDELDRNIWDATRGQPAGAGSSVFWAEQLGRAVQSGLVTMHEANTARRRVRDASEAVA